MRSLETIKNAIRIVPRTYYWGMIQEAIKDNMNMKILWNIRPEAHTKIEEWIKRSNNRYVINHINYLLYRQSKQHLNILKKNVGSDNILAVKILDLKAALRPTKNRKALGGHQINLNVKDNGGNIKRYFCSIRA